MEVQTGRLSKRIRSVFVLDPSKLARLLSVVESKFKNLGKVDQRFQVTTQSGKDLSVGSVEHVLAQDNAVKNPIRELSLLVATADDSAEAFVNFDREGSAINIRVSGQDVKWASELFGEVEEQVERTLVQSWVYTVKQSRELHAFVPVVLAAVGFLMIMVSSFSSSPSSSSVRRLLLAPHEVSRLEALAEDAQTVDERVAFVAEFLRTQLKTLSQEEQAPGPLALLSRIGWPAALVALPVVIVVMAAWYLFARCYPGSAFVWGDYADHLKLLADRRRFLWSAIVVALVVGVVANLAVYGASQFLRP